MTDDGAARERERDRDAGTREDAGGTVENEFDAEAYDDDLGAVYELADDLVDLLDPEPGERVLDAGAGTGHLAAEIAERGADVVGVDRSPEMVARARSEHPELTFHRGDLQTLPFEAEFDAVFSNAALHWVDDQDAALASIRDALRPGGRSSEGSGGSGDERSESAGGRFVAEMGAAGNVAGIVDAVRAELEARGHDVENPWHFPTPGEYATRLEEHGFEVRTIRQFDRPTPLDGGEDGLATWLDVFGDSVFAPLEASERAEVVAAVEDRLRDDRWDGDRWVPIYRRLRFVAVRP